MTNIGSEGLGGVGCLRASGPGRCVVVDDAALSCFCVRRMLCWVMVPFACKGDG
jgi:hypothetical protein